MIYVVFFIVMTGCNNVTTVQVCSREGFCGVGFVNETGGVTTAAHNVSEGSYIIQNGYRYRFDTSIVLDNDVSLSRGDFTGSPVEYCTASPGDSVNVYVRRSSTIKEKYHATVHGVDGDNSCYLSGYVAEYGHSGSPVVSDEGCIIGIVISRIPQLGISKAAIVKPAK